MASSHRFHPLSPQEITLNHLGRQIHQSSYPGHNVIFRVVTHAEPPKAQMIRFLEAERSSSTPEVSAALPPKRTALVQFYLGDSLDFREIRVDLTSGERLDESKLTGKRSYIDGTLMNACEEECLADKGVQDAINQLELPENAAVVVEAWTYGTDGMRDMSKRLVMGVYYNHFISLPQFPSSVLTPYPLDLCVEMTDDLKMLGVKKFDRSKIHDTSKYHPDLVSDNYRTGNAVVTRSRILVLQTIITAGNYEYIFAFQFTQDAAINYEVRGRFSPYGTLVAPGVLAPYHQHLFSLRIDPAIDGFDDILVVEDSIPMPLDNPKIHNSLGIGYITSQVTAQVESTLDTDITKGRVFKITNENVRNPVNNGPVGYKLVPHYSQMLLAHPTSLHAKRSKFCSHPPWSLGGVGIASWIKSRASNESAANVRNQDIVLWHTFGTTHNPRIKDWPVMPAEKMLVSLKLVNFFTGNPAVDVPIGMQEQNMSVLVDVGAHKSCAPDSLKRGKAGKG
ncbi:amine oxidase [Paracoccidioides lutzii Pb01]|uniref:Amine oxidase n=1 Tax=Paracoccidioides lutzii (strain ATCC MYA-826 / Pb01) TaxID=502779 RepID=C1GU70_PARBA|nr:amine oxidase [Paracoccidioides lutzii Pb01]EEH39876.2 amine oxidase [Paracoccidioides lutzii Pb01]